VTDSASNYVKLFKEIFIHEHEEFADEDIENFLRSGKLSILNSKNIQMLFMLFTFRGM
jgi:hypothetical protein